MNVFEMISAIDTLLEAHKAGQISNENLTNGAFEIHAFFQQQSSLVAPVQSLQLKRLNTLENTIEGCGFANMHGYSDVEPYEIVRVISEKTIEIRRLNAKLSNGWKPEILPGGFAGHCTNQHSQTYDYGHDEAAPIIRARLRKDGKYHSAYGQHRIAEAPRKFHDYNF